MYQTYRQQGRVTQTGYTRHKAVEPAVVYAADTVWGAAAHAHSVNNGYFKTPVYDETGTHVITPSNRDVMKMALADQTMIQASDVELGQQARAFIAQQLTMKTLKGHVSDFDASMTTVVGMGEFTSHNRLEIALVASQIRAYQQAQQDLVISDRIDRTRGHLADVDAKVQAHVEVTRVVYSKNYGVYFISGITDTNQAVFFSYRERHAVGTVITIKGTVKAHRPDATQLSRVRVI